MYNKKIYQESLSSYEILKLILYDDEVSFNKNYVVTINGIELKDKDNKGLMIYNMYSKLIKRKNKNIFNYLNFYDNCDILVDLFLENNDTYESIDYYNDDNYIYFNLRTTNNKKIFEEKYILESNIKKDYYITTYIKYILNKD